MIGEKPIKLILVRHGNTFESGQQPVQVGSRTDMLLTEQGKKQAHDFANYLLKHNIMPKAIYAGTLKRQVESAKAIGRDLHIEKALHLNEPALTEIDYGLWEGLTAEEIREKWPEQYAQWNGEALWAEGIFGGSFVDHLEAIAHWLDVLCKSYESGDTIVGVTSNGVIRFFYTFVADVWEDLMEKKEMESLKVKTGHFCEILIYKNTLEVLSWNQKPET